MAGNAFQDARRDGGRPLLLVFFFVFLFFVFQQIAIFADLAFLFFLILLVQIVGDKIEMDGMGLRDFQLGLAFRTTQDLAFLDLVFIDVDFSGTFRATDHGSNLRRVVRSVAALYWLSPRRSVLYTAMLQVNCRALPGCF
jgi:hypothetical protein